MLDTLPVTITVVLDSWCSEAFHRHMLQYLIDALPARYVFYNLCYEPWSRKCIKFDSSVANIVCLESNQHLSMFQPARIAPLETEIAPQIS